MPTPIIGLFGESSPETQFSLVMVIALELMHRGLKVLLVDANPGLAPFAGVTGQPIPQGVSFLGLLGNPDAEPMLLDLSKVLGNTQTLSRGGSLHLLPALAQGEQADAQHLSSPRLHGARRFLALRTTLGLRSAGTDLVLLVANPGRSNLAAALLAHGCDAAVHLADSSARQVLGLAQMAREADVLRGDLIPHLCVETRDDGQAVPEGAWQALWRTHPALLPPHRKGDEGPERLLILDERGPDPELLADAVIELATRAAGAAPGSVGGEAPEGAFGALYLRDRQGALALFNAHMAPRMGTRKSAVAALQAVWDSEVRTWDDVQHLAKFVVQKFRWEDPSPEAEVLLPIYHALQSAAERGDIQTGHARVLIDRAGMLLYAGCWRLRTGRSAEPLLAEVEPLLRRAQTLPRRPQDQFRNAEVLGVHAHMTGSAVHYELALEEMRGAAKALPRVQVLQAMVDMLVHFSHAEASLWTTVLDYCRTLDELDPRYSSYNAAIAHAHLGQKREALLSLQRLGNIDRETYLMAFEDPGLAPLWVGVGQTEFFPDSPMLPKR